MWDRYSEPLSLNAMAKSAYLSRFYFCRLFRSITGTTPGRFLTAIRLYKAKNLLLDTDMSVTDIAYSVGYNSLGTFISRFTRSVGVSPARYRWLATHGSIPTLPPTPTTGPLRHATVDGYVVLPPMGVPVKVYIGAFASPIVQGPPVACDVLEASGSYQLSVIPEGGWYLRAAAIALDGTTATPSSRRPLAVGSHDLLVLSAGDHLNVNLELHPTGVLDPPILVALPELDSHVSGVQARGARDRTPAAALPRPRPAHRDHEAERAPHVEGERAPHVSGVTAS